MRSCNLWKGCGHLPLWLPQVNDHHVEECVVSSDDGHVEVLEDFTDNSDKEPRGEESDKEPEEYNHNKMDEQTISLEHHKLAVAQMQSEMQALKKRLGDSEEQLKEAGVS